MNISESVVWISLIFVVLMILSLIGGGDDNKK